MPCVKDTGYLHVCIQCGKERFTSKKQNPSGLCAACARLLGRLPAQLHFLPGALYAEETLARFWSYVDKESVCACHPWENRCWLWTGQIAKGTGYGAFALNGRPIGAHRFAYQAEHGLLAPQIYVLHKPPCLLRHCVRHLYAGTPKQNTADMILMDRLPHGENHWSYKHPELLPHGDDHWTRKTPELLPHGDDHWTHKNPELIKRGDDHWARKNPEFLKRGDDHWARRQPERLSRGEQHAQQHHNYVALPHGEDHWTHKYPERVPRGATHPQTTLTEEQVRLIRRAYKTATTPYGLPVQLARHYGVTPNVIYKILSRETWRHLDE